MPLAHSLPRSNWNTSNKRRRRRNQGKEEKKRGDKRKVEIRRDLGKMTQEQGYRRSLRSTSKMIDRRTMGNPKDPKGSQNHQDYQSHHNPGSRS
jgi:hypothetical protein